MHSYFKTGHYLRQLPVLALWLKAECESDIASRAPPGPRAAAPGAVVTPR